MDPAQSFDFSKYSLEGGDMHQLLDDLMTAYGKDVWNYAYSITRKWDVADDITQEVFIKVYKNLHVFRKDSSVKTWLLTITRNTAIDYKRTAFIRKVTLVDFFEDKGGRHSAEHEVLEKNAVSELWEMVLQLPEKYRDVIVLYAHYQLSLKEISEVLNVTEGTVKSRMFHARKKLERMKEVDGDG